MMITGFMDFIGYWVSVAMLLAMIWYIGFGIWIVLHWIFRKLDDYWIFGKLADIMEKI